MLALCLDTARDTCYLGFPADSASGVTRAENEPSRSLKFHNHREGPRTRIISDRQLIFGPNRGLLHDCESSIFPKVGFQL